MFVEGWLKKREVKGKIEGKNEGRREEHDRMMKLLRTKFCSTEEGKKQYEELGLEALLKDPSQS